MLLRVVIVVALLIGLAGLVPQFLVSPSGQAVATLEPVQEAERELPAAPKAEDTARRETEADDVEAESEAQIVAAAQTQRDRHGAGGSGRAAIYAGPDGHYYADATIRGRKIDVVVDTGASVVALNMATAKKLGIAPPASAFRHRVQTANGSVDAAAVTLAEVRLGGVRVRNVQAVVLPDSALDVNLLGMSFLGRLSKWQAGSGRMELIQ